MILRHRFILSLGLQRKGKADKLTFYIRKLNGTEALIMHMADIFIIYAREDRVMAEKIYKLLSEQWDTMWDERLTGDHRKKIPVEIKKAGCIVPLYSARSLVKDTVVGEIAVAIKNNKEIIPIRLDGTPQPYDFPDLICVDMQDWDGDLYHPNSLKLKGKIATIVEPIKDPKRPQSIVNGRIPLPSIFLSISSYNTKITLKDAVNVLNAFRTPIILISAYDLIPRDKEHDGYEYDPQPFIKGLQAYQKNGGFILMDSGKYEATRLRDNNWNVGHLKKVLKKSPCDLAFCFDILEPSLGHNLAAKEIVEAAKHDQNFTSSTVLPIVHAPELKKGGYKLEYIPKIIRLVSEQLNPPIIAIPERELGAGLISRARMVRDIRKELNSLPYYQPLHLLGTGNPWAIAVLAAAGADTFDGLEWCRYTMFDTDIFEGGISHFHLFDLFGKVDNPKTEYAKSVIFNNLNYFRSFGNIMHDMFTQNGINSFVQGIIGRKTYHMLKKNLPEIFE